MSHEKNEFDDLFSDSTPVVKKPEETKAVKKAETEPVAKELEQANETPDAEIEDLFAGGGNQTFVAPHDYSPAMAGAGVGALLSKKNIFSPSAQTVANSRAAPFAEKIFGAPAGSVAQTYEAMHPTAPTLQAAARTAAQNTYPTVAEMERMLRGATTPENVTGRQGVSAFNTETSRLAELDKQGKMRAELLRNKGLAPAGVNPILESGPMGVTKSGIHVPATTSEAIAQAGNAEQAVSDAVRNAEVEKATAKTTKAARLAGPLAGFGKILGAAGTGAGVADTAARLYNKDYKGAAISGAATALPYLAGGANMATLPLSLFALWAHDNPEKVKELMKSVQKPNEGYDYQQQMMGP